jgi:hypothetical protein
MAKRIDLGQGKTATLYYRGDTEDERIESALMFDKGRFAAGILANTGNLTPPLEEYFNFCAGFFVEVIPDKEPTQEPLPQAPPEEPQPVDNIEIPSRTARRRIT